MLTLGGIQSLRAKGRLLVLCLPHSGGRVRGPSVKRPQTSQPAPALEAALQSPGLPGEHCGKRWLGAGPFALWCSLRLRDGAVP